MTNTSLPIFLKRIDKELENFNKEKYITKYNFTSLQNIFKNINVDIIVTSYSNTDKYFLKILKNNKFYLELSIPSCYPFRPYEINNFNFYSNQNYLKSISTLYEKMKNKNKNIYIFFFENQYQIQSKFICLDNKSCYCCNSITCPNNWSPNCRIDHILIEYLELEYIKKYVSDLSYKYLNNIYNNLFLKLPDEIIKIILNKNNISYII